MNEWRDLHLDSFPKREERKCEVREIMSKPAWLRRRWLKKIPGKWE